MFVCVKCEYKVLKCILDFLLRWLISVGVLVIVVWILGFFELSMWSGFVLSWCREFLLSWFVCCFKKLISVLWYVVCVLFEFNVFIWSFMCCLILKVF